MTVTLEYGRHGITCNAVLPGMISTELVQAMPEEIRESMKAGTPARRIGEVGEVARLVAFLASDHAAFVNGAVIPIDGGLRLNASSLGSRKEARETRGAS
jgi:NAD(P)-dependent dehydrogenase (short-subunit alcohol dehydrogenase family)